MWWLRYRHLCAVLVLLCSHYYITASAAPSTKFPKCCMERNHTGLDAPSISGGGGQERLIYGLLLNADGTTAADCWQCLIGDEDARLAIVMKCFEKVLRYPLPVDQSPSPFTHQFPPFQR